ncbi:protein SAWADEE HOMEODOMAIN HOMOLOG 1-like [Andrographis paniculata]|uniref:protein SAWADEE HOMEODOMAIN HOMOLOG 1-like n=1 Tax=Andrographis paniculata TaxID=175694 RepID=UPI0021E8466D|nr:protein SAWADEE HOMEODOMAIN HOMOLOG 1-like [Andrographis paniculata]
MRDHFTVVSVVHSWLLQSYTEVFEKALGRLPFGGYSRQYLEFRHPVQMDLRPRQRQSFTGFTEAEVEKMEEYFKESKERTLDHEFCKNLARGFNRSSGRASKPAVKWTEIENWFREKHEIFNTIPLDEANNPNVVPQASVPQASAPQASAQKVIEESEDEKGEEISGLEFEARSTKDGAWYDVDAFLSHRFLSSEEIEVCVRFVGFGSDEDEWVSVRDVRERSVTLEHSECQKLKVGDRVLCFQEREDEAKYYEAHIVEIEKRWHDIRGCRCRFLVRYGHDNSEETVQLRRLCCRPSVLARFD